jgi:hypothetical protein
MDTYSGATSGTQTNTTVGAFYYVTNSAATIPTVVVTQFFDYSATDKHKSALIRFGSGATLVGAYATRWADNSAVTSIELIGNTGNFLAGSTLSLYGIAS